MKKKRISEGRKQIKREGRKQTIELKNQCVSEFLFVLQVTMTFIASIERKRGENSLRSTIFLSSPETAYEPTHQRWRRRVEHMCHHCYKVFQHCSWFFRNFSNLFPTFERSMLEFEWCLICFFFNYCWILMVCKKYDCRVCE